MSQMASQITSVSIVCLIVYSNKDHRGSQSSASHAFVDPSVTSKMFPFDDVTMHIPMLWRVLLQYHTNISVTWVRFYTLNGGDGNGDGDGHDDDDSDGDGHDDCDRDVGRKHDDDDNSDASEKITKRELGT